MEGIGNVTATSTRLSYFAPNELADDDEGYWWNWVRYSDGTRKPGYISRSADGTLGGVMGVLTGAKGSSTPGLLTSANGGGDERRGKLRKAPGICKQDLIRRYLNGTTR